MQIWRNLLTDPQAELGTLARNEPFKKFVTDLEDELEDLLDKILDLQTLMEAQHRCAAMAARRVPRGRKKLEDMADGLSQYEIADIVIDGIRTTEEGYCKMRPGMTDQEFWAMQNGELTVGELLERRPAVILAPLLRQRRQVN